MPADADPVSALLDPDTLRLPGRIVAGFAQGMDAEPPANALSVLSLDLWVARRRLAGELAPEQIAALDRLDAEVRSAMETLRRLTGAPEDPDFG
ncbi:MAG: hypothetical protein AB1942_04575 [Pseudomonadota bacterium]